MSFEKLSGSGHDDINIDWLQLSPIFERDEIVVRLIIYENLFSLKPSINEIFVFSKPTKRNFNSLLEIFKTQIDHPIYQLKTK